MDYDFHTTSKQIFIHFQRRGYPKNILIKHRERARKFTPEALLTPKAKITTDR
jgi:hypothetical protein